MKSTIIFGNGLGRSLDSDFFDLSNAMKFIWDNSNCLTMEGKELIKNCIPSDKAHPDEENDLEDLYYALISCKMLNALEKIRSDTTVGFLSDQGKLFFNQVALYVTLISRYYHTYSDDLPDTFLAPLFFYLKNSKSHVATLNYDNLLYKPMIEKGIVGRYDQTCLVDGFNSFGFKKENLNRLYGHNFGWYLHLHGSPLFRDDGAKVIKKSISEIIEEFQSDTCSISNHIVLSHIKHKEDYIANSCILKSYWEYLEKAILESNKIYVIGYSGQDIHLNRLVKDKVKNNNTSIEIVKRKGNKTFEEEKEYWEDIFGKNVTLHLKENLLDFVEWS